MTDIGDKIRTAQRLRFVRFRMSVFLYGIWAITTMIANTFGMIETPVAAQWALTMLVIINVLTFGWLIKSGNNLRFADPSMTFAQCIIGLILVALFMFYVPEWRDLLISIYLMVLMFGVFQMSTRQFSMLALFAFTGFLVMNGAEFALGRNQHSFYEAMFRAAVVVSLLVWAAYFGNHVGSLRERLQARNEDLQEVVKKMTQLAERDHLTQAYNRRTIIESLGTLREGALRYKEVFSIVIIDLDFFKQVNDRFGHLAGDEVLSDFASRVRSELRLLDEISPVIKARQLGRYGGEEFILILPRTDITGALDCAERIRTSTISHKFNHDLTITLSAGVAQFTQGETIENLLRRADKAMYAAKDAGRNTVVASPIQLPLPTRASEVVRMADYKSDD